MYVCGINIAADRVVCFYPGFMARLGLYVPRTRLGSWVVLSCITTITSSCIDLAYCVMYQVVELQSCCQCALLVAATAQQDEAYYVQHSTRDGVLLSLALQS